MVDVGKNVKILFFLLSLLLFGCFENTRENVIFEIGDSPYSPDPIEYDYFIHHQVFRSVIGTLVSVYSKDEIAPFLASSWEYFDNKSRWKFNIRENITFENGDKISTKIIYQSFCRMAYLQKVKSSRSGLLEFLVNFDQIQNINSCPGISYNESSITFTFDRQIENLLESISFGHYGIVHPQDYNNDGSWKNDRKILSSSFYKVLNWTENELQLDLRDNFKLDIGHPNKIKRININWKTSETLDSDLRMATSLDLIPPKYTFFGGAKSKMAFLRISSWKNKKFYLSDREKRTSMRDFFYKKVKEETGFSPVRSFFPTSIPGVSELNGANKNADIQPPEHSLKFAPFRDSPGNLGEILEIAAKSLKYTFVNPKSEEKYATLNPDADEYVADLLAMGTGILIEKPEDDVRYMFLSKEGIRLPDETGEIYSLLEEKKLNLQKINELLFEQAIIWPLTHFADGVLAKDHIDVSMLNTIHPPIDFAFIGLKK